MLRVTNSSVNAVQIAASLSGVPFLGAAAIILQEIVQLCNDVRVQKKRARFIAHKCAVVLNALNDQSATLVGTELQTRVDELTGVLEAIQRRMKQWASCSRVVSFVKSAEIIEGLNLSDKELDQMIKLFQINALISINSSQHETQERTRSDMAELRDLLYQVLSNQGEIRQVAELQNSGENAGEMVMREGQLALRMMREESPQNTLMVANVLSSSPLPMSPVNQRYREMQKGLVHLQRLTGIPPSIEILNGEVIRVGELAVAGGTYSDIWQGQWLGQEKVALKALRNIKASDPRAQRQFKHEIHVWARLKHENILPFYGLVTDQGPHMQMVSPWQENGNVLDYVKANPDADRIHLLVGAAKGLEYLHSQNIIHGNVKCANILVSGSGSACVCDFGMSKVIEEVTEKSASATLTSSGSARWLAPELIEGSVSSPTKEADTYSYAMAILELVTGKYPYANRKRDASVIHDIVVLKRIPSRPSESEARPWLTEDLWALMKRCWRPAPERPSMSEVSSDMSALKESSDKMDID